MLVLTRKSKQKIIIGNNIVLTVLKMQGDQVSIGIEAPKTTLIYREEIYHEIMKANEGGAVEGKGSATVATMAKSLKGAFKGDVKRSKSFSKVKDLSS